MFWNGNAKKHALKWLKKFKIKHDAVYANVKSKLEICQQLNVDFMIEDNPAYAEELNNNGISTFLIKADYNKKYDNHLNKFAENWLDLYVKLGAIYKFDSNDIIFEND